MSAEAELLGIEDLDRQDLLKESQALTEPEKQCRIFLAEDWKKGQPEHRRFIELPWNPGGPHGRLSVLVLKPGKSVVRPLWQAMVWFGPFGLLYEFQKAETETRKQFLREKYAAEKMRILNRFDYPRPISAGKANSVEPVGPHRFPDVTCTVVDSEGVDLPSMRLHKLYKIGEFDEAYPLESFGKTETVEEVTARYEAELTAAASAHQKEMEEFRRQFAELGGMVKGLAVAVSGKEK